METEFLWSGIFPPSGMHKVWGVCECCGRPIFFLIIKENWLCLMARLSQTLIYYWQEIFLLTLKSDIEAILSWYHWIVCGLSRTIKRMVNLNAKYLGFVLFWFGSFRCMVWLLFHSLFTFSSYANKQVVAKWVLKIWIIINKRHFVLFLDNCSHKYIKPRKSR